VILDDFMTNSQYASLSAVKNHHVYAINADIINRPGPRIADAAEEVSRIISAIEGERVAQQPVTVPGTTAKTPGFSAIIAVLGFIAVVIAIRK
jgi:iron complex transport system substrate-binding protein